MPSGVAFIDRSDGIPTPTAPNRTAREWVLRPAKVPPATVECMPWTRPSGCLKRSSPGSPHGRHGESIGRDRGNSGRRERREVRPGAHSRSVDLRLSALSILSTCLRSCEFARSRHSAAQHACWRCARERSAIRSGPDDGSRLVHRKGGGETHLAPGVSGHRSLPGRAVRFFGLTSASRRFTQPSLCRHPPISSRRVLRRLRFPSTRGSLDRPAW